MTSELADALRSLPPTPEVAALRDRHCEYYRSLCREAMAARDTADEDSFTPLLNKEIGNLRLALTWSIQRGNAEAALELASGARSTWLSGHTTEGGQWLTRALALGGPHSLLRVRALIDASEILGKQVGRSDATFREPGRLIREAVETAPNLDDPRLESIALRLHCNQLLAAVGPGTADRFAEAVALHEQANDAARRTGDDWLICDALFEASRLFWWASAGDRSNPIYPRAQEMLDEAERIASASSDTELQLRELHGRAIFHTLDRRFEVAESEWQELLERALQAGSHDHEIMALASLAVIAEALLRIDEAKTYLIDIEERGHTKYELIYFEKLAHVLGCIALRRGEYEEAGQWLDKALAAYEAIRDPTDFLTHGWQRTLATLAHLAEARGDLEGARRWIQKRRPMDGTFTGSIAHLAGFMERRGDAVTAARLFREAAAGLNGDSPIVQNVRLSLDVSAAYSGGQVEQLESLLSDLRAAPREALRAVPKAQSFARLGLLALSVGDVDRARPIVDEGIEWVEADSPRWGWPELLIARARIANTAGQREVAREAMNQVLGILDLVWEPLHLVDVIEMLGCASLDDPEHAAELLALGASERERYDYLLPPWQRPLIEESMASTRATLGAGADAAERRGRRLELWPTLRREAEAAHA